LALVALLVDGTGVAVIALAADDVFDHAPLQGIAEIDRARVGVIADLGLAAGAQAALDAGVADGAGVPVITSLADLRLVLATLVFVTGIDGTAAAIVAG